MAKTKTPGEKPKLDMFNKILPGIDRRDKELYASLNEEERKAFGAWLIMRYMSSAEHARSDVIERYLIYTNNLVNVNFSDIKDDEFKWLLMTAVGCGASIRHPYIAPGGGKRKKKNHFKEWLRQQHPHLDEQELNIMLSNIDKRAALDLLEQYQVRDKEIIDSANDL